MNNAILIADKTNYLNPNYTYIKNVNVVEWDIKSAGFSVLKAKKVLSEQELDELSKLDKHTRTVKEGLLQKAHPEIADLIINTLAEVRKKFVEVNNINENNIIAIKKDALFLLNSQINFPTIDRYFEFRKKNSYTSYINLNKKEFYYDSSTNSLDVKGFSKEVLETQKNYIFSFLKRILKSAERVDGASLFNLLLNYRRDYLNRTLPVETYRELDSGYFRIEKYFSENATEEIKDSLDISQNYMNYLLPLFQALL